jgi:LuxR family maltose regulon positive regulatory protein
MTAPDDDIRRQIDEHLVALARLFSTLNRGRPADVRLAPRELSVAVLAGTTPLTNAEIAARLNVSIDTVKTNLRRVYAKLGIDRRGMLSAALADVERAA